MNFNIRRFKKKDSKEVSNLIFKIFEEFNAKDLPKRSIQFFMEKYSEKEISEKWIKDYVIIVEDKNKIIAIGRAKKNGWITHCYVDKDYMNEGIGKVVMYRLENWLKRTRNRKILLNSSPYALGFYKSLEYKPRGRKKSHHGIQMYPMEKWLN